MKPATFLAALVALWTSPTLARKPSDAILLSKVKSLTLRDGQLTSHRRVSALPQLNCVGGNACAFYHVDVMRCTNSGSEYDAEDISWTCKASLPPEFKLGSTEVVCEGYDSSEDPYVLKGSCAVEYRLMLTEAGERKYAEYAGRGRGGWGEKASGKGGSDWIAGVLFWIVFVGIVGVIAYSIFFPDRRNNGGRRAGNRGGFGGGGGGGDDGWDDPPPPYTPRAPKPKTTNRSSSSRQQEQAWRPGFWSGAAAGAAAGYGASAWNNRNRQQQTYAQPGASSWFGSNQAGPSGYGAGPSRSPPAPSSSRQESTGFGGTRRR